MAAAQLSTAWVKWAHVIAAQTASEEGQGRALRTMARCAGRMGRGRSGVAFRTWRALVEEDKTLEEKEKRLVMHTVRKMMAAQVRQRRARGSTTRSYSVAQPLTPKPTLL